MAKFSTILLASSLIITSAKAQTPPMGWMSWNAFGPNINENILKQTADALVSSGMKDAGYKYIFIDDGWPIGRDAKNNILPDPKKFPSGIKALADYVHSKGLKLGIYSDAAPKTCGGYTGSLGFEKQDAASFAAWGVDYLKYDYCNAPEDSATAKTRYNTMYKALAASGRKILLGICEWGGRQPWRWAAKAGGTVWRTTGDVRDKWKAKPGEEGMGILDIVDINAPLDKYAHKGHWNDPDMLVVGLYGRKGPASDLGGIGCNDQEYQSQFSLYCIMAAPLAASNDIRDLSETAKKILTNKEAIAIDQDPLAIQGKRVVNNDTWEIFVKPLANGETAVAILNKTNQPQQSNVHWSDLGLDGDYEIRDLWTHQTIPQIGTINAHETKLLRLKHTLALAHIFSDNMVLQRDHPLKIWGTAAKGEKVTVTFRNQSATTTTNDHNKWSLTLQPVKYGGPFEMTIHTTAQTITYKNILVGDVWLCSGQSNMEFPISGWSHVVNYQDEIKNANYPDIRLFNTAMSISGRPEADVKGGQWQPCSPATISPFSAVGYFFGRELYRNLKIPIGLVSSVWGGTDIESWTSRNSLDTSAEYHDAVKNLPRFDMDSLNGLHRERV
ncbi:MAG: alpha-galactosidase, partial [Bacteroidetes bacterium]|nr:alpha-galactosidase [Bacteroidota bacterium]